MIFPCQFGQNMAIRLVQIRFILWLYDPGDHET